MQVVQIDEHEALPSGSGVTFKDGSSPTYLASSLTSVELFTSNGTKITTLDNPVVIVCEVRNVSLDFCNTTVSPER